MISTKICVPKNRENDKIQLSPPVTPGVLNTLFFYQSAIVMPLYQILLRFWIILLQNAHHFDLLKCQILNVLLTVLIHASFNAMLQHRPFQSIKTDGNEFKMFYEKECNILINPH